MAMTGLACVRVGGPIISLALVFKRSCVPSKDRSRGVAYDLLVICTLTHAGSQKMRVSGSLTIIVAGMALASPGAFGQDAGRVLEEVIVTAQKREESLRDVPISVAAFSGEQMRANNVTTLQALSTSVPNFFVAESFVGDALYIRGIGSGQNNLGFEQAVGQVIDGYFYGRSRFSRLAFLGIEGPAGRPAGQEYDGRRDQYHDGEADRRV
jgi:hypothetical protein